MSKYTTLWVADEENRRDYKDRQYYANQQGAVLYIEFHFNAKEYDQPGTSDNPCSVIVADNASQKSKDIANKLSKEVSTEWGFPNRGTDVVDSSRAGYWNLYYTAMPAVLTELLYASDPDQATIIKSEAGQRKLARIHADVIREYYPMGGKIAFSIGHKFKASSPFDRGAPVYDAHTVDGVTLAEADYAQEVALFTEEILNGEGDATEPDDAGKDDALELIATGLEQAARGVRMLKDKPSTAKKRSFLWFKRG